MSQAGRGSAPSSKAIPLPLPAPLHAQNRLAAPDGVCYTFGERSRRKSPISQRMRNLEWRTAQCRADPRASSTERDCKPLNHTSCPKSASPRSPPGGFSYCHRALSGKGGKGGKVSPGALALLPGAQLERARM